MKKEWKLEELLYQIGEFERLELINEVLEDKDIQSLVSQMTYRFKYWDRKLVKEITESIIKYIILKVRYRFIDYGYEPSAFYNLIRKSLPNKIRLWYRKELIDCKALRLPSAKEEEKGNVLVWANDFSEEANERLDVERAISMLTGKQQKVVKAIYFLEVTEEDIAKSWGVSQQSINRTRNRALAQLKNNLY